MEDALNVDALHKHACPAVENVVERFVECAKLSGEFEVSACEQLLVSMSSASCELGTLSNRRKICAMSAWHVCGDEQAASESDNDLPCEGQSYECLKEGCVAGWRGDESVTGRRWEPTLAGRFLTLSLSLSQLLRRGLRQSGMRIRLRRKARKMRLRALRRRLLRERWVPCILARRRLLRRGLQHRGVRL